MVHVDVFTNTITIITGERFGWIGYIVVVFAVGWCVCEIRGCNWCVGFGAMCGDCICAYV